MKPTRQRMVHNLEKIFQWIVTYKTTHDGNSPSVVELMAGCAISSRSVALYQLHRLHKAGYIHRIKKHRSRSICVVGGEWRLTRQVEQGADHSLSS